jgi:histidinol-phosphatase (PHP family)
MNRVQNTKWPVEIKFGLEVCYFEGFESLVEDIKNSFDWDFITGSVHWIDNWGFDHKPEFWEDKNVNHAYTRYFDIMENLIKTKLFDHLAHPDSIKCFNHFPDFSLLPRYKSIAELIKANGMKIEQSAGLHMNYHHPELGMNKDFIKTLKSVGADIITASDAHRPEDVGRHILQMQEMMNVL